MDCLRAVAKKRVTKKSITVLEHTWRTSAIGDALPSNTRTPVFIWKFRVGVLWIILLID
jgi:hypothetical protein